MTRKWFQVSKAEFLASTARFRGKRRLVFVAFYVLGIVWAFYFIPTLMSQLIGGLGFLLVPFVVNPGFFPGFVRAAMMLVWFMLIIYPISSALQEIKIGQWEIMLSHDVKTRSIMVGTFLAKIPIYAIVILFLAPILVSPFAMIYSVSIFGQVLMYVTILLFALGTLWLANFLSTAIQSKLGDSPRGNDLAKALGIVLGIIIVVPMYSLIYVGPTLSQILGTNIFLFFPFTWTADLFTWIIVSFNGLALDPSAIAAFASTLTLSGVQDLLAFSLFSLVIIGLAFASADRLFRIGAGMRVEKIVTVKGNGPFLRLVQRVAPGSFGIVLASSIKDFMRKAQNVSMLAYAVVLSIILPFFLNLGVLGDSGGGGYGSLYTFLFTPLLVGWMLAIFSAMSFGGVGFLDSQDQLWVIKAPSNGVGKYIKARVVVSFLMGLIIVTPPAIVLLFLMNFSIPETIVIWLYGYASVCGSAMIGIGVSAIHPSYEDTQSGAFKVNRLVSTFLVIACTMVWFFVFLFVV